MKSSIKPILLKGLALSAGALGFMLRATLFSTGVDGKGLLIAGHWASSAMITLAVLFLLGTLVLTRFLRGPKQYRHSYPGTVMGSLGAIAAAGAILRTTLRELDNPNFGLFSTILGFAAALSLVVLAIYRAAGKRPLCLLHGIVCIFFAARMVGHYRHLSPNPELMSYLFFLCAYIALMLTAYYHTAFDAGMGNHKNLWFTSLNAAFLSLMSLRGNGDGLLLLCSAFWALTNTTSLKLPPRRRAVRPQEEV